MATIVKSSDQQVEIAVSPMERLPKWWGSECEVMAGDGGQMLRRWSHHTELVRSDSVSVDGGADLLDHEKAIEGATERLVESWASIAIAHAIVRTTEDSAGYIGTVVGIDGAWAYGETEVEALEELKSALVGWALLKLEDGDDDIPSMEGVHLVIDRAWRVQLRTYQSSPAGHQS